MIATLKKIFGLGPGTNYNELINNGAVIIDVRTEGEFSQGHVSGSVNIPVDRISARSSKLNKEKPVILCCASGMRSGSAAAILRTKGFKSVYNAGSWLSLRNKLKV